MKTITKILATLTMCAVVITAYQSRAEEKTKSRSIVEHWQNIYLRLDVGKGKYVSKMQGVDKRPKITHVFGYGIGYNLPWNNMRVDLSTQSSEFSVFSNTNTSSHRLKDKTRIYMLGLYKGFRLPVKSVNAAYFSEMFVPYVTAFIGNARFKNAYASNDTKVSQYEARNDTKFVWGLGAGAQIKVGKVWSVNMCYRYMGLGKILTSSTLKDSRMDNHQGTVSLLMKFW